LLEDCYDFARNQPGARWFSLFVGCLLDKARNPSRFTAAPFCSCLGQRELKKSAPGQVFPVRFWPLDRWRGLSTPLLR
jgi:hypothetical protein